MTQLARKKRKIQFKAGDDTCPRNPSGSSSSLSLGDFDDDEDAIDFLGGARGHIPSGPVDDLADSPIFVPGWGFQVDNPGRDLQSCRDYILHTTPPVIKEKMDSLNARQSINRGLKATFDGLMWNVNTLRVANRMEKLNRKLGLTIKADRAQLSAEREKFESFRAEHAADLARIDQVSAELESLRSQLSEQVKKAGDMEVSLQQSGLEVNAANTQRSEALAARDQAIAEREQAVSERDQAIFERDAAMEEKKKLQMGLPDLIITSMSCPGIITPFGKLVQCARAQGRHETAILASQFLDPLPDVLATKIDPDIPGKLAAANQVLASLSTSPFLEKLVEDLNLPVDVLLAMKPQP